jgi:hypothetical protein
MWCSWCTIAVVVLGEHETSFVEDDGSTRRLYCQALLHAALTYEKGGDERTVCLLLQSWEGSGTFGPCFGCQYMSR